MSTQVIGYLDSQTTNQEIDSERGLIPRSKYIVQGLELAYGYTKENLQE